MLSGENDNRCKMAVAVALFAICAAAAAAVEIDSRHAAVFGASARSTGRLRGEGETHSRSILQESSQCPLPEVGGQIGWGCSASSWSTRIYGRVMNQPVLLKSFNTSALSALRKGDVGFQSWTGAAAVHPGKSAYI